MYTSRFQAIVSTYERLFPTIKIDVNEELKRYKEYSEKMRPFVKDTVSFLHNSLASGKTILVEGANAAMLDIDFGNYIKNFRCKFNKYLKMIEIQKCSIRFYFLF